MAARRYEISLRVLKNISRVSVANEWNIFNTRREISYLQAAMWCSIYYINTNEIPNDFTETVSSCERRDLLCSHSNGDIFNRKGTRDEALRTSPCRLGYSHAAVWQVVTQAGRPMYPQTRCCSGNLNSLYQRGVMLHQAFPRYCHAGKHIVSFYNVASQPSLGSSRNTPSQFPPRSVTVCDGPNAFAKYSIGLAS